MVTEYLKISHNRLNPDYLFGESTGGETTSDLTWDEIECVLDALLVGDLGWVSVSALLSSTRPSGVPQSILPPAEPDSSISTSSGIGMGWIKLSDRIKSTSGSLSAPDFNLKVREQTGSLRTRPALSSKLASWSVTSMWQIHWFEFFVYEVQQLSTPSIPILFMTRGALISFLTTNPLHVSFGIRQVYWFLGTSYSSHVQALHGISPTCWAAIGI